jgi:gas vesicle protein
MKKSNVVLGVLAGAAVGALLGILFAPDKGSRTRKKIYRKGEDVVDDLKDKAHVLAEKANNLAHQASKLVDKVNESVTNAKREAHDMAENAKSKFADLKHRES